MRTAALRKDTGDAIIDHTAVVSTKQAKSSEKVIELKIAPRQSKPLPQSQQEALIAKYRLKARKLGRSILRRWHARLDLEEVDSLVDLSLCEAVRRFDPTKGASFMTFLFYHLKGNLVRAVADAASAYSIPVYNPEDEQAVENSDQFAGFQFRGLNSVEVSEALYNNEVILPDEALWRKELKAQSNLAADKLDALEKEVIGRIYVQEEQLMDIASSLGYSRCHISRVKKRALETLHDELKLSMKQEDLGRKPNFDEGADEEDVQRRVEDRRAIHRRRPRSRKSADVIELNLAAYM